MRSARVLSPGHPDRACDIIVETVVDEYVRRDPTAALRLRACGGRGALFMTGVVSSTADFDVGAIATRTAAALGIRDHMEPFIAIEHVPGSFIMEATRSHRPVTVVGYATMETEERMPAPVTLAKRIAKHLDEFRHHDTEWYWLEPAFEVTVCERPHANPVAYISCAHGEHALAEVRERIAESVARIAPNVAVRVNLHGNVRVNGLDHDIGAAGVFDEPYGSGIIVPGSSIGCDPSNPVKFGTWLARGLARRALERSQTSAAGSLEAPAASVSDIRPPSKSPRAVLVRAAYAPSDREPSWLSVRDEHGNDLLREGDAASMTYAALRAMLRAGLSTNAAHWGFAGEVDMPWEEVVKS